jgi:hypothetical protein
MMIPPDRPLLVGDTEKFTVAAPLPLRGGDNVIQVTSVVAVHPHSLRRRQGDTRRAAAHADVLIQRRKVIAARRTLRDTYAAVVDDDLSVTGGRAVIDGDAKVDVVRSLAVCRRQSRDPGRRGRDIPRALGCVVTENLPAPPAESITGGEVSETWHLTTSGLVSEIEEDVPQPLMNTAAHRRMAIHPRRGISDTGVVQRRPQHHRDVFDPVRRQTAPFEQPRESKWHSGERCIASLTDAEHSR